ncbi:conserved hypothetical protein [Sphingomonas aurantiaca]|uniref:Uncharacterized protein n=1 Tax=Sphingomonas aurantiaca TaxID=185949 RepID=A0A5E7Z2S4_9SPHN|nr:conserved hypothetical protein [Sphingomonas aurantiaca]
MLLSAGSAALQHRWKLLPTFRHPDASQDPGLQDMPLLALSPDFRQDDVCGRGSLNLSTTSVPSPTTCISDVFSSSGKPRPPPRHPDESQDPELRDASLPARGPDVRQDDGRWVRLK